MTDRWTVLLWGDEDFWENASPEAQERVMGEHGAFSEACERARLPILGGEELGFSKNAVTVQRPEAALPSPRARTSSWPSTSAATTSSRPTTSQGLARLAGEAAC